jgi:hypothetical protein
VVRFVNQVAGIFSRNAEALFRRPARLFDFLSFGDVFDQGNKVSGAYFVAWYRQAHPDPGDAAVLADEAPFVDAASLFARQDLLETSNRMAPSSGWSVAVNVIPYNS